jgi:hypothetical protein
VGTLIEVRRIMKHLKLNLFSCVVVAAFISLFLASGVAEAAAWKLIPSPSPGVTDNELFSVATVAANDVWTVGDITISGGAVQTLTEHWNGTQWSVVTSPNPGAFRNVLNGVIAVSSNDVWAVGTFNNASDVPQTLAEHWNGTQWSAIPSPNVGHSDNFLNGATAISTNDVWAVGQFRNASGFFQTLTLHWNGKKWKVVASPNVGTNSNVLSGVTAISTNDVWSVGNTTVSNGFFQTLTEHWNGTQWSIIPSPNPNMNSSVLNAVRAVSTSDVWAVGQTSTLTLIEHWNGTQWSVVKSPSPGTNNLLRGVAVVSAKDIWAVGFEVASGLTLIEHWNGTKWSVVKSPNPSSTLNVLDGAAADPVSHQTWAVGVFFNASGVAQTLTLFHP